MVAGGLLLALALFLVIRSSGTKETETPGKTSTAVEPPKPSRPLATPPAIAPTPSSGANPPTGPRRPAEEVKHEILLLSVQYTAANVPKLGAFLTDPDSEIRTAALEGLVNLGESSASPVIRQAAMKLQDPEEIQAFEKAAAFLDLPSDNEVK